MDIRSAFYYERWLNIGGNIETNQKMLHKKLLYYQKICLGISLIEEMAYKLYTNSPQTK